MGLENSLIKWEPILEELRKVKRGAVLPSVSEISEMNGSPFKILISTVISLRTKDKVTLQASLRLFKRAPTPGEMLKLSEKEIEKLIYPAGFYRRKAVQILKISSIVIKNYNGEVPQDLDSLVKLPGVGRKTANLTLGLGYGIPALCVDTHVHRIANRIGWFSTKNPDKTETALKNILPKEYWIEINELLVIYGQNVCTPASPHCSKCSFSSRCPKIGVDKSR